MLIRASHIIRRSSLIMIKSPNYWPLGDYHITGKTLEDGEYLTLTLFRTHFKRYLAL